MKNKILIFSISLLTVLTLLTGCGKNSFTVTFDTDGGSKISEQTIKENEKVSKPSDPTKEGYILEGWIYENNPYDFSAKVEKSITLKAKWKKVDASKSYTIKFDTDGGNRINNQTIQEGGKIVKPTDPFKADYVFESWTVNGQQFDFNSLITKDMTLTATWKKADVPVVGTPDPKPNKTTYTVTFNSNGGSAVSSKTVNEGTKVSRPSNPTKTGQTFQYWALNGSEYNFNSNVTKNITLTAVWKANAIVPTTYTVTFDVNGGSAVGSKTVNSGEKVGQPTNPTKTGFTFQYWTLNGTQYNFGTGVTKNITLTAVWKAVPVADVYTLSIGNINNDATSVERLVKIKKNGVEIVVSQLLDQNGKILGNYNNTLKGVRVNKEEYNNASSYKVKLSDGTIVNIK